MRASASAMEPVAVHRLGPARLAPVAQLDRALPSEESDESWCTRLESLSVA